MRVDELEEFSRGKVAFGFQKVHVEITSKVACPFLASDSVENVIEQGRGGYKICIGWAVYASDNDWVCARERYFNKEGFELIREDRKVFAHFVGQAVVDIEGHSSTRTIFAKG